MTTQMKDIQDHFPVVLFVIQYAFFFFLSICSSYKTDREVDKLHRTPDQRKIISLITEIFFARFMVTHEDAGRILFSILNQ